MSTPRYRWRDWTSYRQAKGFRRGEIAPDTLTLSDHSKRGIENDVFDGLTIRRENGRWIAEARLSAFYSPLAASSTSLAREEAVASLVAALRARADAIEAAIPEIDPEVHW